VENESYEEIEYNVSEENVEKYAIADMAAYAREIAHGRTVQIFDTTLRDGEQSPGATLHEREKMEIARQLARLGVDIIEAGFPIASEGDFRAVQEIAKKVGRQIRTGRDGQPLPPPIIAGLARALEGDIRRAAAAVAPAVRPRIHTFIATSDIHLEHKLHMSRNQVLESVGSMVELACNLCTNVEFSPEDAGRSDVEFLKQVLAVAIQAGATTLNIPDTVGYTMSSEYGSLIEELVNAVPGGRDVIFSTHTHNDLGLATANSLAGVKAGARQVEVAVNGIGERAGNSSLEEFTMALHTRSSYFHLNANIVTEEIHKTSEMVSRYTGMVIQPNKAVVGANAFQHEAGIHQDGVLKNRENYEIMRAATVGKDLVDKGLPLGKHSGRHAVRDRLQELGYSLEKDLLQEIYERFMQLSDRKKEVSNADLEAIAGDIMYQPEETWALQKVQVSCGSTVIPTAVVILKNLKTGEEFTDAGFGTGPVDAVYKGINRIVKVENTLTEYLVQAVTQGMDANGDVTIRIEVPNDSDAPETAQGRRRRRLFSGRGVDTDIVTASAKAYLQALNKQIASN
jgi:2-isopropylmalate synthase